ncbi:MAG: VOC family protein [Ahrensia sp.]|nr:VOC family protein [Ahrensia sp.]
MPSRQSPRAIDHLVLPVVELVDARERYGQLGFTVAPDAQHPFGTENCCIFLPDGTFLEPLAITHRETCETWSKKGNPFIRRDQAYRFRVGDEGFSHLVIKSDDASADHRYFKKSGISQGKKVRFSRRFEMPDGGAGEVAFKLAFAGDARSPDSGYFACEPTKTAKVDRSALLKHENGAVRLKEVIATEINPTDFQYFFQDFLSQRHMTADSFGMSFETANARLTVLTPEGARVFYGIEAETRQRGVRLEGFVIGVADFEHSQTLLDRNEVAHEKRGESLIVPPAKGQGATIIFEASI